MTIPARQRTPFGLLDASHHDVGTTYTKVRKQASLTDMAQLLREGTDIVDVAEAHGIRADTLRCRLHDGGWSTNGQPNTTTLPVPTAPQRRLGDRQGGRPTFLFTGQPWALRALCVEVGGDIWFPEKDIAAAREAKRICRRCPVARECLTAAFDRDERFGIFGGLTYKERRKLKKGAAS